ncbi:hypothetical protein AQUCO_06500044v1 [Aquilegia coerulea]|uniref:Uncharacterized protein n=1 Tax=Aquilegia coerulea TaxID=218851 RepID=A0A2G5CCE5_AQUCA|nr:hypothetical protein AQUCO_06500044v1 [Aquilegia coerulea]
MTMMLMHTNTQIEPGVEACYRCNNYYAIVYLFVEHYNILLYYKYKSRILHSLINDIVLLVVCHRTRGKLKNMPSVF